MHLTPDAIALRLKRFLSLTGILMCVIGSTLFYFQIYQKELFTLQSKKNFLRHETINSLRGTIFDTHGTPLATNRPSVELIWNGTGKRKLTKEQQQLIDFLSTITKKDFTNDPKIKSSERYSRSYTLAQDLPFDQLSKIAEQCAASPNIILKTTFKRHYPYNTLASHILGYFRINNNDNSGKMGLERAFEEQLKGEDGTLEKTINATGTSLQKKEIAHALNGKNIATTIDLQLQKLAEQLFSDEQTGCLLMLNPYDGALKVVMSRPTFDPNIFLKPISTENWHKLQTEKPFLNRGFNASYPPASLFKLITTAAALEEGIITDTEVWNCKGRIRFGGRAYRCNRQYQGHGEIDIEEALAASCNIPFYEIGKKITIDTLSHYAHKLGLGSKTGTLLPEKSGLVPTSLWKQQTYGEPWWQGETLNAAIGQGPFLVTPVQMGRAFGGICTGMLVKPRILKNEPIQVTPVEISLKTLSFLKQSMKKTVLHGTGRQLNKLEDIDIYAKTGTAQTSHLSKRKLGKQFFEHAWFVGYAQYKDFDPFVLVILIEHAGTARFATRMAKQFFIKYCELMDQIAQDS